MSFFLMEDLDSEASSFVPVAVFNSAQFHNRPGGKTMDVKSQACFGSISMLAMSFVQHDKHQNCYSSPYFLLGNPCSKRNKQFRVIFTSIGILG